jgi:hypothetical protein
MVRKRLWATLRFRLGMKLTALGLQWLHLRNKNEEAMEDFPAAFEEAAKEGQRPNFNRGVFRALHECIALCSFEPADAVLVRGAAELLLGRRDVDDAFFQAAHLQAVILDNGLISASLESLLESDDPDCSQRLVICSFAC